LETAEIGQNAHPDAFSKSVREKTGCNITV